MELFLNINLPDSITIVDIIKINNLCCKFEKNCPVSFLIEDEQKLKTREHHSDETAIIPIKENGNVIDSPGITRTQHFSQDEDIIYNQFAKLSIANHEHKKNRLTTGEDDVSMEVDFPRNSFSASELTIEFGEDNLPFIGVPFVFDESVISVSGTPFSEKQNYKANKNKSVDIPSYSQDIPSPDIAQIDKNISNTPALVKQMRTSKFIQKLPFYIEHSNKENNNSNRSSKVSLPDYENEVNEVNHPLQKWILHHSHRSVSIISYESFHRLNMLHSISKYYCCKKSPSILPESVYRHHIPGHVLIITSKSNIEKWADLFRPLPNISILLYTDTLAKRRKMGTHKISTYNVVITTFDILAAKEVRLPEDDFYDSTDREKIQEFYNYCDDGLVSPWLFRRSTDPTVCLEISQLHLIKWNKVLLDIPSQTFIRLGNNKGDALRYLLSDYKVACLFKNRTDSNDDHSGSQSYENSKEIKGLRDVLNLNSKVTTSDILFKWLE